MMYDELIKQLKELASLPEHCENIADCDKCPKEEICLNFTNKRITEVTTQAADTIEKLAESQQWILVTETEQLPDEKTPVLILADTIAGKIEQVSYLYKDSDGRNCWTALDVYGKNPFDWQPTHWMPLPELPKEEMK